MLLSVLTEVDLFGVSSQMHLLLSPFASLTQITTTTGTHVASNARAFRKMTPGSAKRRARIFVGIMCLLQVVNTILSMLTDNAIGALMAMCLVITIIVVYLVGSCKLQVSVQ